MKDFEDDFSHPIRGGSFSAFPVGWLSMVPQMGTDRGEDSFAPNRGFRTLLNPRQKASDR